MGSIIRRNVRLFARWRRSAGTGRGTGDIVTGNSLSWQFSWHATLLCQAPVSEWWEDQGGCLLPAQLLWSDGGPEMWPGRMLERVQVGRGETQSREGGQSRGEDHPWRYGGQKASGRAVTLRRQRLYCKIRVCYIMNGCINRNCIGQIGFHFHFTLYVTVYYRSRKLYK